MVMIDDGGGGYFSIPTPPPPSKSKPQPTAALAPRLSEVIPVADRAPIAPIDIDEAVRTAVVVTGMLRTGLLSPNNKRTNLIGVSGTRARAAQNMLLDFLVQDHPTPQLDRTVALTTATQVVCASISGAPHDPELSALAAMCLHDAVATLVWMHQAEQDLLNPFLQVRLSAPDATPPDPVAPKPVPRTGTSTK